MLSRSKSLHALNYTYVVLLSVALTSEKPAKADQSYVYAVQVSATVQSDPPEIRLSWEPDPYGADRYTVYRKGQNGTAWGAATVLPGTATRYVDRNVAIGGAYEYQIVKSRPDRTGYGYIHAGIRAPLKEARGKLILIVDNTQAAALATELAQLKSDLIGDGWQVIRRDVARDSSPGQVKGLIVNTYNADPWKVKAVFLFGHVPILRSGTLNYDGHGGRPMPADTYYADVNGDWSGNPSYLPSDVELMVGRVDFFNMRGPAGSPWPSETELLRNYLRKNHAFRNKEFEVPRRALMGNRVGDEGGHAAAACGYRTFHALVGPGNIVEANVEDSATVGERWISLITSGTYLWAYGNGGGDYKSISQLGTHGLYNDMWSSDVVGQDARAVFSMLYGSHMGEWDTQDNVLRAMLATPSLGLTACLGGKPHWYLHHMGLGEPIGYSARLTMNNGTLYRNQKNPFRRGVHIGLLGDPTLRLDPVAPPYGLRATRTGSRIDLSWSASREPVAGYHVYRASRPGGPYTRLTTGLLKTTSYTDPFRSAASSYMVRAVKVQTNPSGSYLNPSQGTFVFVGAQ